MTNEEINIAIAESLGWTYISQRCMWGLPPNAIDDGTERCLRHFPNYAADLNACHEFVKTLSDDQRREYILRLCLGDDWRKGEINMQSCIYAESALPKDRCEAYLRTIGQWKE